MDRDKVRANNFYPRPPRGGRHKGALDRLTAAIFLSTPSARRATTRHLIVRLYRKISIHALREEGDEGAVASTTTPKIFLSTPSARRATVLRDTFDYDISISIHALREEGDLYLRKPLEGY